MICADDLAVGADGGGVAEVAPRVDEADHRRAASRPRRDLLDRLHVLRDEPGLEEEVLGRVPRDDQLGEHGEVASLCLGLLEGREHAPDVAREVADHRVQLARGDTNARHDQKRT